MEKEVIEIYREVALYETFYFDSHSPYEVEITVKLIFVNIWWRRFINFLLSPFTTYRINDFRKLYDISVSKPSFKYPNIEEDHFENYVEKQKERLEKKWFRSSETSEILKSEIIKYKCKNRKRRRIVIWNIHLNKV